MSKQTDLINIPDAITVSGDNVGIGANSLSLGANNANSPQILFENSDGVTGDAALSTYDDALGTMLVMGSNFYINSSGSESRFNTSEESSAVMLNRNGDLNLLTGGTGATATTRLKIDSSGRVTTPNQPMFSAHGGAEQTGDVREVLQFTSATSNVGNHFSTSTYTFTAPVSGHYHFSFSVMTYAAENSRCSFAKNGSLIADQFYTEADGYPEYPRNIGSIIVQLSTNDTLRVDRNVQNSGSERCHSNYRFFTGYLLG
jgi:hypothetical protein